MNIRWAIAVLSIFLAFSTLTPCGEAQTRVSLTDPQVQAELSKLPTRTVVVSNDPIYEGQQSYEGYDLRAFLTWLSRRTSIPLQTASITFIASDGYWLEQSLKDLPDRAAALAFRHIGGSSSQPFGDARHGMQTFNPGPYAVVWEGVYRDSDHLPIPWSITEVILQQAGLPEALRPPRRDPKTLRGLELWRSNCSRCHSLNKFGGGVGPELNVPLSITEYWSRERLLQLIENPASLRWNSKMPSFSWMSQADREAILDYLEAMRETKVCRSESECLRP